MLHIPKSDRTATTRTLAPHTTQTTRSPSKWACCDVCTRARGTSWRSSCWWRWCPVCRPRPTSPSSRSRKHFGMSLSVWNRSLFADAHRFFVQTNTHVHTYVSACSVCACVSRDYVYNMHIKRAVSANIRIEYCLYSSVDPSSKLNKNPASSRTHTRRILNLFFFCVQCSMWRVGAHTTRHQKCTCMRILVTVPFSWVPV